MDLSIIIVTWNVKDLLRKCLRTIETARDTLRLEIFVVDNASTDGTAAMVATEFPAVRLIANQKNVGFATANNQAITQSTGRYVLALNPDTELMTVTLKVMVAFMDANPSIGISGCKHLNPDNSLQPSVRQLPTLRPIILMLTKLAKFMPNLPSLQRYLAVDFDYQKTQTAPQVAGSFFLMRREMLQAIGPFDPSFFIWFEEVDLCQRAVAHDWQVWYNTEAVIIHHGGASFKQQLTLKKQALFFKSAWRYFKKHGFVW